MAIQIEPSVQYTLSVVVPCHNEATTIPLFMTAMNDIECELENRGISTSYIFIDDGSTDETLTVLRSLVDQHSNIGYLSFSRNFGKEAAIYAGLEKAIQAANLVCIMDADLQDPPSLLPQMIDTLFEKNADRVAARRVSRAGEPPIRSFFARSFYRIMGAMTNLELRDGARDYSVMTSRFIKAVLSCNEYNRFTKGLFGWVGYKTEWVEYENIERAAGESSWSFTSLFSYALDGIMAYSVKPLEIISGVGAFMSVVAVVFTIVVIVRALLFGDPVAGWPSTMVVLLITAGLVLLALGFIGQYLAKLYMEVKKRPIYLLAEEYSQPKTKATDAMS